MAAPDAAGARSYLLYGFALGAEADPGEAAAGKTGSREVEVGAGGSDEYCDARDDPSIEAVSRRPARPRPAREGRSLVAGGGAVATDLEASNGEGRVVER